MRSHGICGAVALLGFLVGCAGDSRPTTAPRPALPAPAPERLATVFAALPGGSAKPARYWIGKTLDRIAGVPHPTRTLVQRYAALPTKAEALATMIESHGEGFRDRLHEFGLRFIEFLPHELYRYDPHRGERVPGIELAAFRNVRESAEAIRAQGNFFALFDFPLEDLRFRFLPTSENVEESLTFQQDWLTKPFFRVLTNSVSNRNRKRSAWVLRNFLCDDLSTAPTSAEDRPTAANARRAPPARLGSHPPLDAASGAPARHASEVGCKSCHWKLDYIGAFFRYYDSWGNNYRDRGKYIEFASQAIYRGEAWDAWMAEWRRPDGRWYAGVHRRALTPDPRDWDASAAVADPVPEDLFHFLKTDADANRCVAKRMADAFIGSNLTYDGDWLHDLSRRFKARPVERSGLAFLEILGTLVFSSAYVAPNPDPDTCYDTVPGRRPRRIPCGVYRILETQCLSCHGDKALGLDLHDLVEKEGALWLDHEDAEGRPRPVAESYRIFRERLETSDPTRRMPYGKPPLSNRDVETLVRWLDALKERT